eukprot:PhM_4_TR15394/c0_g1_i1/m.53671
MISQFSSGGHASSGAISRFAETAAERNAELHTPTSSITVTTTGEHHQAVQVPSDINAQQKSVMQQVVHNAVHSTSDLEGFVQTVQKCARGNPTYGFSLPGHAHNKYFLYLLAVEVARRQEDEKQGAAATRTTTGLGRNNIHSNDQNNSASFGSRRAEVVQKMNERQKQLQQQVHTTEVITSATLDEGKHALSRRRPKPPKKAFPVRDVVFTPLVVEKKREREE